MLQLRPFQKNALDVLRKPAHLLCVASTGSGKSLIYERAAAKPKRRTLLVSPLVALARQQAARLSAVGLRVVLGAGRDEGNIARRRTPIGEDQVWIVSPEMIQIPGYVRALEEWRPDFLVVDECHCLWEWGDDFRPAFALLPALLERHEIDSSLWLTATLPRDARGQLKKSLPKELHEQGSFELPVGLDLTVIRVPWPWRAEALMRWMAQQKDPGIIFTVTREASERIARLLSAAGFRVVFYHAGLGIEERRNLEVQIAGREKVVVVATSAFGMGMDFDHLRWAVLWQAPSSLLALAQAVGRVGRAGRKGRAVVFWDHEDFRFIDWMIKGSARRRDEMLRVLDFLSGVTCAVGELRSYFEGGAFQLCQNQCNRCQPELNSFLIASSIP